MIQRGKIKLPPSAQHCNLSINTKDKKKNGEEKKTTLVKINQEINIKNKNPNKIRTL